MRPRTQYPDWVEAHRGPGREIKKKGNCFYLSTYKTIYDKKSKKPKKVTLQYLGKITPDGLQAPVVREREIKINPPLEFGTYHLLDVLGKDILDNLAEVFGEDIGQTIFVLGKQGIVEPAPMKRRGLIYDNSYDSVTYPGKALSPASLTRLLADIGGQREKQVKFMKKYLTQDQYIIFDGTRLVIYSGSNELGQLGYNHCGIKAPQANLLYCFSLRPTKGPVYFRVNAGDKTDYDTIVNAIYETEIKNVIMIADKGFGSQSNFNFFKENGLSFIVPLRRDSNEIDYSTIDTQKYTTFDGYFAYHDRTILYQVLSRNGIKEQKVEVKKRGRKKKGEDDNVEYEMVRIAERLTVLFLDVTLRGQEMNDYAMRLRQANEGYTMGGFGEKQDSFGTITLTSNVDLTAEELYGIYKERGLIEDGNKAYKNVLDVGASNLQSEQSYNGWLFVNHIALMLYYRIFNRLKEKNVNQCISVEDVIARLSRVTMQKIDGKWIKETGTKNKLDKIIAIFPEYNTQN